MGGPFPPRNLLLVFQRFRREINLTPENRLHIVFARRFIKLDRAVQISVVRHGQRRHAQLRCARGNVLALHRPVQRRVLGVQMQMNKRLSHAFGPA